MTPEETKAYILAHYEEQTLDELAKACGKSEMRIRQLGDELDIILLTKVQRKIKVIRAANGEKTARELSQLLDTTPYAIRWLCNKYKLSLKKAIIDGFPPTYVRKAIEYDVDDVSTWPPEKRHQELEKYIENYTRKGFSRFEALKILHEIAEYLLTFGEWKKSTIERPKAIYANQTRDELIEELLNDTQI